MMHAGSQHAYATMSTCTLPIAVAAGIVEERNSQQGDPTASSEWQKAACQRAVHVCNFVCGRADTAGRLPPPSSTWRVQLDGQSGKYTLRNYQRVSSLLSWRHTVLSAQPRLQICRHQLLPFWRVTRSIHRIFLMKAVWRHAQFPSHSGRQPRCAQINQVIVQRLQAETIIASAHRRHTAR